MAVVGHFSGRIGEAVDTAGDRTTGVDGKFYSILNSHGFYDVSDTKNGLTDEQRAMVPAENQNRMSDLASAISEMIHDYLGNPDYGVMTGVMQDTVDKLDANISMADGKLMSAQGLLGTLTGGSAAGAMEGMSGMIATAMGVNPYDPDLIPPISIGLSGLPISISNVYTAGYVPPDYQFLYDHEHVKSPKIYANGEGKLCIGCGIPLTLGGKKNVMVLKYIFAVTSVNKNMNPSGDCKSGLSPEQFKVLIEASTHSGMDGLPSAATDLSLNETQIQMSFFRYVHAVLWGTITNPANWAYLHWGAITNNACPERVRTAVSSYLWSNGLMIQQNVNSDAAFISYCLRVGMAYQTGSENPIMLCPIKGDKYISGKSAAVYTASSPAAVRLESGVPHDEGIANRYFTYIADILCRLTSATTGADVAVRKRRVDEANLIYGYVGINRFSWGWDLSRIDRRILSDGMTSRRFGSLMGSSVPTYDNVPVPVVSTGTVRIKNHVSGSDGLISDHTKRVLTYIAEKAGLKGLSINSVYRSPPSQASAMFANKQKYNGTSLPRYSARGSDVYAQYDRVYISHHGTPVRRMTSASEMREARNAMSSKCQYYSDKGSPVSRHGWNQNQAQAVDMGPNSLAADWGYGKAQLLRLKQACLDAKREGYVEEFFCPGEYGGPEDPAFHVTVKQDAKLPPGYGTATVQPTLTMTMKNANLKTASSWDVPLMKDANDKANGNG